MWASDIIESSQEHLLQTGSLQEKKFTQKIFTIRPLVTLKMNCPAYIISSKDRHGLQVAWGYIDVFLHSCTKSGKNFLKVLPGIEPGLPEDTDMNQNPE